MRSTPALAGALCLGLAILFLAAWKTPRALFAVLGAGALFLVIRSGNAAAFLTAGFLLGMTALIGDGVIRLIRGFGAEEGEVSISVAAGCAVTGVGLLLLGEAGLARPGHLAAAAALLILARRRRIPELSRIAAGAARSVCRRPASGVDALWTAAIMVVLVPGFLGALRPDLSWDALAYHLPQIRDFAEKGRVLPLPNLYPATFLWRSYDTFLGLPFLAGGERAVRWVHLGIGLAAFGAAAALARRVGGRRSPLPVLALCAFPAAALQLRNTFVDLSAALLVTASAAEIAASRPARRRVWLAGLLFGAAVATKIFALLAAPALTILLVCRHGAQPRRWLSFALFAAIPILPWLAWSQTRLGFFLAPYYDPWKADRNNPLAAIYGPPTDPEAPRTLPPLSLETRRFLRLPYDLTFEPSQFSRFGEYVGLLPLLLLVGLGGWGRRRFWLICAAGLAALIPLLIASSLRWIVFTTRYLIPVYPLYAVAAASGLSRATGEFRGRSGHLAAAAIAALVLAVPIELLFLPADLRYALGRVSSEDVLNTLPAYPLWRHVRAEDRVLLLGDPDRYHCPARFIVSDTLVFPTERIDPHRWSKEWRPLGINVILHRTDRRNATDFLQSLGPCVRFVAAHALARLYRVDAGCLPNAGATPRGSDLRGLSPDRD